MAGSSLSLTCSAVHVVAGLTLAPDIVWMRSNRTLPHTSSSNTTSTLVLDSISTSQAGPYVCTGVQHSPALAEERKSTSTYLLEIESKLFSFIYVFLNLFISIR